MFIYPIYYLTIRKKISFFNNFIPKPHEFVTSTIHSGSDIYTVVTELNVLLPQLADFIGQFQNVVSSTGINVVTDSAGNMSIDIPQNMSDSDANFFSKKIGVIDRLITTRGQSINDLFQEGLTIEDKLKKEDPKYISVLGDKITQFKKLNSSYKH